MAALMRQYLLPVSLALLLAGDDTGQPLDRARPCHPGDYQPQGEAVVCGQGPARTTWSVSLEASER